MDQNKAHSAVISIVKFIVFYGKIIDFNGFLKPLISGHNSPKIVLRYGFFREKMALLRIFGLSKKPLRRFETE